MRRRLRRSEDDGLTLIELIVAGSLSVVLLTIIGALVISGVKISHVADGRLQAVGGQKVISQSLQNGIAQADWVSTPTSGTSQFVTAHVLSSTGSTISWSCRAWYWTSAGGGALYTKQSASTITAPTGTVSGWTMLASGVTQVGTTPVLAGTATSVTIKAQVAASGSTPALVSSTVFLREPNSGGTACR